MGRLDSKVALISGAARGMGATEAMMFAQEGARVAIGDVLDELGSEVARKISEAGGEATYQHLDVTQNADWQRAVDTAVSIYGKLDILVNNAGIVRRFSLEDTTVELWDEVMAVNVKGVFLGTKCAIPAMRRSRGGSIVNISSTAGLVGVGQPAYIASKGAVRLFTKATAIQYAKENIRCNSVHPGDVDTFMMHTLTGYEVTSPATPVPTGHIPLGRVGTTEDIAYGVLFLASDEASFVTGSEMVIDGGCTAE